MPDCISCVVYAQGCNRNCEYCHNPESINRSILGSETWPNILNHLTKRQGLIDAVVFSGGEPTIQKDLVEKILCCKELNYKIGLHTNGDGDQFKTAAPLCDYILLSHYTEEKIKIVKQIRHVQLSTVINIDGLWENKIQELPDWTKNEKRILNRCMDNDSLEDA